MGSPRVISILLADDHSVVLEGLSSMLRRADDLNVVATASNGKEAVELYKRHRPNVTLLDLRMPDMDGFEALTAIKAFDVRARVLLLTTFSSEEDVARGLSSGAQGYLLKDVRREDLVHSIRQVHGGRTCISPSVATRLAEGLVQARLTSRESEVLQHLAAGLSNREIGQRLFIQEGTVKLHVNNIFQKLGVRNRTEALRLAARNGLVQLV